MGNQCCTKDTIDPDNGETLGGGYSNLQGTQMLATKMSARQLALIIKVQARIRGMITRNKIRQSYGYGNMLNNPDFGQTAMGMPVSQDYENPKVQEISQKLGQFDYG